MRNITIGTTAKIQHRACRTTALRFEPLTVDAIPAIRPLIAQSRSRANDYTIGGLTMWAKYFDYQYCIYGGTLFVKGVSEFDKRLTAFSLPVGAMPLNHAIELIRSYCRANGIQMRFSAIPQDRLDDVRAAVNGRIEQLTDWSDYIYDASSLATLSGKKLNKKRNHVNRFMAMNPEYSTEKLDQSNLGEVRDAYTSWLAKQPIDTPSATEESVQTLEVIDNYSIYPFDGLLLRDNNHDIVAFTIGEVIGDTLYTHIEKMNHEIQGAGETINTLFAQYITSRYPNVRYINREEDAGDPGLRQAKLSYHPAIILDKYDIIS